VAIKEKLIDSAPEKGMQTKMRATKETRNLIFSKIKKGMYNIT
jgi:hypothetical protein